jgi:hypothetical protein
MNRALLVLPLALGLGLAGAEAHASMYPPSYPTCGIVDTVTTGPFELVKKTVDYSDHAQLTVAYRGYLRQYFPDNQINIYVRLNGNDAFLPASAGTNGDAYIFLDSGPRSCVWCSNGGFNVYPQCDGMVYGPYASGAWWCAEPNATEANVFYWAFNEHNRQNAWDIEVAAESHGYWDSNWGNNYDGRFEPEYCY